VGIEGDAFRFCDGSAGDLGRGQHRRAVIALPQQRPHLPQRIADESVGKDRLQAVADFDAILMILDREEHQEAGILTFFPNAPFAKQSVGVVFYGIAIGAVDGDQGDLRAGGTLHLGPVLLNASLGCVVQDMGEVADVALWLE